MGRDAREPLLLAPPGDTIWQLLATPMTVGELTVALESRFAAADHTITDDATAFVAELVRLGLVRR